MTGEDVYGPGFEGDGKLHGHASGKRYIILNGELDCSEVQKLCGDLRQVSNEAEEIYLDLANVSFVDLACLRAIVKFAREIELKGKRLVVTGAHDEVAKIMGLTGASFLMSR